MGFKSVFSKVWEGATDAAKASVATVNKMSVEAIDKIQTGYKVAQTEIEKDLNFIKEEAAKAKDYSVDKIKKIYEKSKEIVSGINNFVTTTCPLMLKGIADFMYNSNIDKSWDGKYLPNCEMCQQTDPNDTSVCYAGSVGPSTKEPAFGKIPKHKCEKKPLPKIYFINGINNTPQDNCKSTKEIAYTMCAEVIGVYNRTQGVVTDLLECLGNIFNSHPFGGDKPTKTLEDLMLKSISKNPPKPITLFAHSQGGLITRESLGNIEKTLLEKGMNADQIKERMKFITIKSFGTAENNWPNGPNYEQYDHPKDMVPDVIELGDTTKAALIKPSPFLYADIRNPNYEKEIEKYNAQFANISNRHIVDTKKIGAGEEFSYGIGAHDFNNSYIPYLKKQKNQQKNGTNDKCNICITKE